MRFSMRIYGEGRGFSKYFSEPPIVFPKSHDQSNLLRMMELHTFIVINIIGKT